jgi:ankyrin repeat protein
MQVMTHAAYVNKKTKAGSSPLRFAVMSGHLKASEVLIKMGGADCLVVDSQVGFGLKF